MNLQLSRRPLFAGLFACLATSLTLSGQTTSSPYEPELNSIVLESKVDLANVKTPAALPASLVGIVSSGLLEVRSRIDTYDPIARTMRVTLYLAAPATPLPAPASAVPPATDPTMVSQSIVRAESILQAKGTPLSLGLAGRFVNYLGGQLPIPVGTPFLVSFAFPADAVSATGNTNATFGELSFLIPGQLNLYAAAGAGSIVMTPPASN